MPPAHKGRFTFKQQANQNIKTHWKTGIHVCVEEKYFTKSLKPRNITKLFSSPSKCGNYQFSTLGVIYKPTIFDRTLNFCDRIKLLNLQNIIISMKSNKVTHLWQKISRHSPNFLIISLKCEIKCISTNQAHMLKGIK